MEEDVINIWKKLGGAILAIDKHTKKISNNTKRIKKLEGQGGKK